MKVRMRTSLTEYRPLTYTRVCVCVDLHTLVPVQQIPGVIDCVHSQADDAAAQQTVEVNRKEFTLHQAEGVSRHLPDQCKSCRFKGQTRSEVKYSTGV